ncbi:hypothetical protein ACQY0O_004729 [Thecaphora frezii]
MSAITVGTSTSAASQPAPPWHRLIYLRLQERDAYEKQQDPIYQSYANLAAHTRLLKQRNRSLLTASNLASSQATLKNEGAISPAAHPVSPSSASAAGAAANPVHLAYISSLEGQLAAHRDEIATLYKTQGQNAQRLLLMNETLREREDECRRQADEIARLTREHERLKRSAEDLQNVVGEKEKMIQVLQDELVALSLELTQIEARNKELKEDNASLLQRWLDKMNEEAERMNEGTAWLEEVRKRRQDSQSKAPTDAEGERTDGREATAAPEESNGQPGS